MAQSPEVGQWLERLFRVVLAGFFIVAGALKIWDPKSLTAAIENLPGSSLQSKFAPGIIYALAGGIGWPGCAV